jgi:hypothetical protein
MKKYKVTMEQTVFTDYFVLADSEEDAVSLVLSGDYDSEGKSVSCDDISSANVVDVQS